MKKLVIIVFALLLAFALAACDNKSEESASKEVAEKQKEAEIGAESKDEIEDKAKEEAKDEEKTEVGAAETKENKEGENKEGQNSEKKEEAASNQSQDSYSKPKHPVYKNDPNQDVIYIREKMFVAQTNDIYLNAQDYLGKKIKYEGMFKAYTDPRTDITYYSVIRYGPGCCGTDMNCGFEVIWLDGEAEYPEDDAWVEVEGVLGFVEGENGYKFLRLDMTSLKVLEKRGLETVLQ